tara:strand:- start:360 stop:506 length:147 start_codon:yes stop_codon:yes gene_type:complete
MIEDKKVASGGFFCVLLRSALFATAYVVQARVLFLAVDSSSASSGKEM